MLNVKLSLYWKLTWAYVIPGSLIPIFIYSIVQYDPKDIGTGPYPPALIGNELTSTCWPSYFKEDTFTGLGWFLAIFALFQIPIWACHVMLKRLGITPAQVLLEFKKSLQPTDQWGPKNSLERSNWKSFADPDVSIESSLWLPSFKFSKPRFCKWSPIHDRIDHSRDHSPHFIFWFLSDFIIIKFNYFLCSNFTLQSFLFGQFLSLQAENENENNIFAYRQLFQCPNII